MSLLLWPISAISVAGKSEMEKTKKLKFVLPVKEKTLRKSVWAFISVTNTAFLVILVVLKIKEKEIKRK